MGTTKDAAKPNPDLVVRCPAKSRAEAARCEEEVKLKWNPDTTAYEGHCPNHWALRILKEAALLGVTELADLKRSKEPKGSAAPARRRR